MIQLYSFMIQHVPGKNKVADAISHEPCLFGEGEVTLTRDQEVFKNLDVNIAVLTPGECLKELMVGDSDIMQQFANLKQQQAQDPILQIVGGWVDQGYPPSKKEKVDFNLTTYARLFPELQRDSEGRLIRVGKNFFFY